VAFIESKMSIKAKNITVKIGGKYLLDNISFEASAGEIVAILGANGAGKSTLLKTFSSELEQSGGAVYFDGKNKSDWKTLDLAKIRGVLPQNFTLDFPFKVSEVALLGRTPHIKFKETRRDFEIVERALEMTEVSEFADRFYPTLSGGERQRVQFARVLAQIWDLQKDQTRFLLLDEPTASLDLAHQHLTLQTAREFADNETVIITVLHDINLAAQYADKILFLKNGKKVAFDVPEKVLNAENVREVFGIEAEFARHPKLNVPLVIPTGVCSENKKVLKSKVY
jgi:iron complex transport system ATP-binding protein